jgi:hypothetical protein
MNVKDIAATLAILGSGALVLSGCGKDAPSTEVPSGADATAPSTDDIPAAGDGGDAAEASCGGEDHTEEGHCGGDDGGAAEGGEEAAEEGDGEASCGGAR